MGKRVNIGVVGSGFAAHFHLESYRKVCGEAFRVEAICGRNSESMAALASRYAIPNAYSDFERLLEDPRIDVVDLCVPNHLHAQLAIRCAEQGKHILCEKPLGGFFGPAGVGDEWSAQGYPRQAMLEAVTEQVAAVRVAVERAGVQFCYAENWVYAPPVAKLARLLAASDSVILRLQGEESHSGSHSVYARHWRTAGGGSLLRLGVHPLGAALHLKAEEGRRRNGKPIRPMAVQAETARLTEVPAFKAQLPKHVAAGGVDVEDFATTTVTFDDGSVAQITASDIRMGGIHNRLTAIGSRAVVVANINPSTACEAYTPDGRYFASEYLVEKAETKEGWSFPVPDEDLITGYPAELQDFIGAVANARPPTSGLQLASDVLLVVYASYLSAEQGRRVALQAYLDP